MHIFTRTQCAILYRLEAAAVWRNKAKDEKASRPTYKVAKMALASRKIYCVGPRGTKKKSNIHKYMEKEQKGKIGGGIKDCAYAIALDGVHYSVQPRGPICIAPYTFRSAGPKLRAWKCASKRGGGQGGHERYVCRWAECAEGKVHNNDVKREGASMSVSAFAYTR